MMVKTLVFLGYLITPVYWLKMYFNRFNMQQRPLLRVFSVLPSLILSLHTHRGFRINYVICPKNPIVYVHGNIWQNMCKHRIFQAKKSVSRH